MRIKRDFIFDPSLVLYLPLYELDGKSFMSRDAYGHLCTVTGALWRPNGRYFDGSDDFISCPDAPSLDYTANTIEIWANIPAQTHSGSQINIGLAKTASYLTGICYRTHATVPTVVGWYFLADTENDAKYSFHRFDGDDSWHHIVGVFNGVRTSIYFDSILKDSATEDDTWTPNNETLKIMGGVDGRYINGLLGEARIYNRALTPLEIQHNYLATKWRYR